MLTSCNLVLHLIQFSYNIQHRKSFDIVTRQHLLTSIAVATWYVKHSLSVYYFAKEWHKKTYLAASCLHKVVE